jgi:transcriptional regulator with XRE-family HTH domain
MSQAQLAEAADITVEWVKRIERGAPSPSFDTVEAISKALDVTVARLFAGYGDFPAARPERLLFEIEGLDQDQMRWLEAAAKLLRNMPRQPDA